MTENKLDEEIKTEVENTESEVESTEVTENPEGFSDGSSDDFKWYIAKTMTGQENKVQKTIKDRIVNYNLTEEFSQVLVPEEEVVTNVNGKKRHLKKRIFPGYVLIKMIMNDRTWHLVKDTDKITGFVGGTLAKPSPLTEEEAAFMTNQSKEGFKPVISALSFSEGESVKVTEGPFASFVGTVEAISEKGKIKVNVSIFGRPTPVELDASQVEKVS